MKAFFKYIITTLVLVFTIYSSYVLVHGANDVEYKFSGINLTVRVPDMLIVFTRHITNNNANLALIGASDASSVRTMMERNNIYLEAVDENATYEIAITGYKASDDTHDYSEYSHNELNELFNEYLDEQKTLSETNEELTETILSSSIETINGIPYFMTDVTSVNTALTKIYVKKYHTVVNGTVYNFAIQSNGKEINSEMSDNLEYIIDSAQYVKVKKSVFDSVIFTETFTIVVTCIVPIIILAAIVFFVRYTSRKNHNKLTNEEAKLREEYNKTHNIK